MSTIIDNTIILGHSPSEVYSLLCDEFKALDWIGWEPDTILHLMPQIHDPICVDKILAVHTFAYNAEEVSKNWNLFGKIVEAFNNNPCVSDVSDVPEIEEVFYAFSQMKELFKKTQPQEGKRNPFILSDQVKAFIAGLGKIHDWVVLPSLLQFSQNDLNKLNGLYEDTDKYKKLAPLMSAVRDVEHSIEIPFIKEDLLKELDRLKDNNSFAFSHIKRIFGCMLFDPCVTSF